MFYLYKVQNAIYTYENQIKVFGSVNGIIVKILKRIVPQDQEEKYRWRINLSNDLPKIGLKDSAIVIDLKPSTPNNVSLYEIRNIFGHSANGWTPMMFHLKVIFKDESGSWGKKEKFKIDIKDAADIFTFHHVYDGTVKKGEVIGKWIPPRPSSTNSALLWEETMDYFFACKELLKKEL